MSRLVFVLVLVLCAQKAWAQEQEAASKPTSGCHMSPQSFTGRPWYDPWPSGSHEPQTLLLYGWSGQLPYTSRTGVHSILEASVGMDIPLFLLNGDTPNAPIEPGCWGLASSLAIAFPMILDGSEPGQPVVGTDYRAAFSGKFAYGISKASRIAFLVQFGHESTHLAGDFTEKASAVDPGFEWFDVTYEFLKLGVNLDRDLPRGTLTVRASSLFALGRAHQGFYDGYKKADGSLLQPSERNYEPRLGIQYLPKSTGWNWYASAEGCACPTYDFRKTEARQAEKIRVSQSYVVGLRDFGKRERWVPDIILRYYVGRNPYGQLREQNTWRAFQFGLLLQP